MNFYVTYERYTSESLEAGTADDMGYFARGGWEYPESEGTEWDLADLVQEFKGWVYCDDGETLRNADAVIDYKRGEETWYTIHRPANITDSSWERVVRLLEPRKR